MAPLRSTAGVTMAACYLVAPFKRCTTKNIIAPGFNAVGEKTSSFATTSLKLITVPSATPGVLQTAESEMDTIAITRTSNDLPLKISC